MVETDPPDICDLAKSARLLWNAQQQMNVMVEDLASARVIKEMHSERCKQSLARAMSRAGEVSAAKAEMLARCDPIYSEEIHSLQKNLETAEKTLGRWIWLQSQIDSLRTLISAAKATYERS